MQPDPRLKVQVNLEHIRKGKKADRFCCPIALAVLDLGFKAVEVDGEFLTVYDDEECEFVHYILPDAACNFVGDFDSGMGVKSFFFKAVRQGTEDDDDYEEDVED